MIASHAPRRLRLHTGAGGASLPSRMPNRVEIAPSGRAACRGCKQAIAKGLPRFAEETANQFSEEGGVSYRYWHLVCAAPKMANELAAALTGFEGAVEDRDALDALIAQHLRPESPYAERAGSGRAKCRSCDRADLDRAAAARKTQAVAGDRALSTQRFQPPDGTRAERGELLRRVAHPDREEDDLALIGRLAVAVKR